MDEVIGPDQRHPAKYWHTLADGRVQCDLCPRDCKLHEGQRGACFVRGRIVAALARDEPWPDAVDAVRIERALDGLVRDGLVVRTAAGPVLRG